MTNSREKSYIYISVFDDAGIDLDKPLLVTCLRGLTACSVAGACHILGKENVPVYQVC